MFVDDPSFSYAQVLFTSPSYIISLNDPYHRRNGKFIVRDT